MSAMSAKSETAFSLDATIRVRIKHQAFYDLCEIDRLIIEKRISKLYSQAIRNLGGGMASAPALINARKDYGGMLKWYAWLESQGVRLMVSTWDGTIWRSWDLGRTPVPFKESFPKGLVWHPTARQVVVSYTECLARGDYEQPEFY